ncbi:MucBP domain-containing protein [Streptococcus parasanguinis]|uniref:mucin-binding protein n=1 Tax=Streptococcus parasanguinis TaxID=1318 RepID=UPI0039C3E258
MNFDRKQRFSIRKYSIGVASVLIGSVLAGTTIASADTEVKIDDASKAPVTSTQEAPKVSAVSAQEASTQEAPTYSANAALVSTEKAEAPKVEAKTETPAKEQASQAEVKENAKDSKNEAKTEETVSEVKAPETEVKSEESEVKEAEKKADSTDKKSEDKPVDLKKEQLDVDKKVPGLDLKNATENPDGGFNIAFSKEAQEQYRASLEAYIARRRNYNRRSSFRAAGADTSTDPDYEFKKVMTPILPGFYADQESIRSLVIDPNNVGDFNFDVWYKKLGSIVLVDEQGNYITPTGETTANQADAAHKQYENDPSDPTRAWFTKVPTIPTGWEVKPGQNVYGYDAARQTVNPNQKDDLDAIGRDTKIVIVKQAQKAIIKYVNENGNVELSRDEVVGKSGEAIDYSTNEKVSSYRRRGFELVSDGFYDAANKNFDFDASVDQEFTVVLRERIEPIDPDKPTPTPDQPVDPKDPDTPKWPDPVKDIVNKDDVTRTVKYVYEDGSKAKEDVSETLHFKRFAYVNLVTGHIDYRPWTTTDDTFDAVTSPVIKGYTADKLVVPAVSGVQAGAADTVEVVTYVKDAQKAIIKYVNEKGNVELSRDAVAGKSGEAINYSTAAKISSYKRQGYELVSDGFTSASSKNFDFDASVDQEFTIVLRERIEPIDPDKPTPTPDKPVDPNDPDTPKWPDPVKDVVNKDDVTRTVKYVYEDGSKAKNDVTETLHFKRFAYVNLVTGHIDYRPWTTTDDTFDAVTSPVIKGYTADKLVVPAVSGVQAGAADTVEVVTYVKDAQKAIIKYVNEKGNVELSRDAVAGKSGEAIDYSTAAKISSYKRQGYELVNDGFTNSVNKNFDFDASVDQEFVVTLRERIEPIDPDKPTPTPDKPVDPNDPDTPKWPDPVKDIVNKETVTRTIHYVYENGSKAKDDVTETLYFKRFAYVNLVTGHVDYRQWTSNDRTFDSVLTPTIKGYTADKNMIPAVTGVEPTAPDIEETVTYVKDAQKAIVKYVNEKGNVELSRDEVLGKSGDAINYSTATKISSYKRQGYELVSDGFTSASNKNFDFDTAFDQEFTVVLRERIEPIDPDKPTPTPDQPVDPKDPDTPKWPDPVKDIVNKDDVTRTVKYVYEDGSKAKEDVSETLHFKRFAYVNLVTGHIDYRPWTTTDDTFDAVTSPVIKGYTADKLVVPAVSGVQAGAADTVEVVTYVKDAQKAIIKYVNEKGNVELSRDAVAGKSGEAINYSTAAKISSYKRQGYELVSDGFTSASSKNFDFDASVDQEFTVVLRERIEPIDPDKPTPTPDKPVDPNDPDTPKWPDPVKDVVNKDDVTRTVKYVYEDGSKAKEDVSETLHFKRFAYVNLVTGHIDYRPWTTTDDTFDAVTSPVIKGYTADKLVVPAVSGVQAGAADTVEVVTYVKDAQKAIIKYINENGNVEVARDTVNGKSGEVIAYTTTDKINELHRKGYELVSDGFTSASSKNFDFDASVDQEFTVVVRERVVPVGPEDPDPTPDTPYDPTDPNTPNWPKNVDKIQNRRAVATRTIRYFVEENGVTVPKPIRERVVFERTVLVNLVTGEMTPQAWKLVSVTRLDNEVENKPVVRTRRALSEGLAPRALETSLARPASHTRSRRSLVIADSPEESTVSLSAVNPEPVVATRSARRSRRSLSTASTTPTVTPGTVLPNVPTPVVEGFYSTVGAIPPVEITPEGELKFDYDVWFKKLGHIQLVDQNGNVLAETIYKNNVTDATKAAPTALPAIPAGYKIKEGQTVYGYDATAGTVDPNNPTDPDAIGRNTTILLELQAVPRQETKVVNETIHYKDAITGETLAPDHTDQVTFRRVVMVNPATNEVLSATSWVADNGDTTFDAVTSPVIEGYEASPLVVDAITGLTAESKDFVTTVLYRKKAVPTPQPDPVKPDPVKPEPVKPNPVKPEPVKPEPTKPATPDAPKAPALPETGVTDASTVTLLGAALGLVGLAGLAKRKRDENE